MTKDEFTQFLREASDPDLFAQVRQKAKEALKEENLAEEAKEKSSEDSAIDFVDPGDLEDFEEVRKMLELATANGLAVEVVVAFGRNMESGRYGIPEACFHALYEWDI